MAWSDAARAAALQTRRAHSKGNKMMSLGQGFHASRNRFAKSLHKARRHGRNAGLHGSGLRQYTIRTGTLNLMRAIARSGR